MNGSINSCIYISIERYLISEKIHFQHGMTLHARVLKLNMEKIQVDLSCKSSDLADKEGKFR